MALFHLSVTQTKRSAGQSAIASAAYRAGERLYSEYYGEYSDYTRKGGVICSDILLPSHARTYACLSAYLPTIDIWNEYKNQNPETLEKPWNTLRKLYQDSNPDISDLTAAIPYTVFPSGLLCHHGRNISFCHDNYRDFFAAFHIANVVYGLCNGINLAALSPDAQEVFLLQLETLDNSILFDAISILRQYFGLSIYDISAQDTTDLSDTCAQIALPAILIRLLDAVIRRGELSKNEYSQLCQLRSTLCERFVLSFKALDESDPLQTKYCLFFSLALSMLARDYRQLPPCKQRIAQYMLLPAKSYRSLRLWGR